MHDVSPPGSIYLSMWSMSNSLSRSRSSITSMTNTWRAGLPTPACAVIATSALRFCSSEHWRLERTISVLVTTCVWMMMPVTGRRRLRRGVSAEKDQSYVLHVLDQEQLQHALFPLGDYTKPQVRALAAERGLPVADKAESQEICFVAGNDYRGFMRRYAKNNNLPLPQPGPILDEEGRQLGEHQGLAYYTIGQRKGLGISGRRPLHVLRHGRGQQRAHRRGRRAPRAYPCSPLGRRPIPRV